MVFNWLIYHFIAYPVSLLPLRVIYVFTDIFYLLLITIIPYRRKVIQKNLTHSFPNKSKKEINALTRRFYRHLTDLLAEGIKGLSINKKELLKRFRVSNPEVMQECYAQNKDVLLVSGHYNNWEWLILSQPLLFPHLAVGVGMPLTNGFWDKKLNERRARNGMHIIHSKTVRPFFEKQLKSAKATLLLADQSPGDAKKSYWMNFLNQQTAVLYGPEQLAIRYNQNVVFFHIEKIKRGYYTMHLRLITSQPRTTKWGEITEAHTRLLEEQIQQHPTYWIWSHKRWKRSVPEDLERLKEEQKERFRVLMDDF